MRDRPWIVAGLLLFVAVLATPFWHALAHAKTAVRAPDLQLPLNQKQCVAPIDEMRVSHMRLLMSWRKEAVRQGQRKYVAFNGKVYDKSLTRTCLGCHNKAEFCDRCHTYAGVSQPYCWNCHEQPPATVAFRSVP